MCLFAERLHLLFLLIVGERAVLADGDSLLTHALANLLELLFLRFCQIELLRQHGHVLSLALRGGKTPPSLASGGLAVALRWTALALVLVFILFLGLASQRQQQCRCNGCK